MGRAFREEFDPRRDFVVRESFTFDGKLHAAGALLDKGRFPLRRLRQLYDVRRIEFASGASERRPLPQVEPLLPGSEVAAQARYRPRSLLTRRKVVLN